jgi:hypothetical protein
MDITTAEPADSRTDDLPAPGDGRTIYRTFSEHSRRLGPIGRGRSYIHCATFTRWATDGARLRGGRRLKLRAKRLPGYWVASDEDVAAFIDAITQDRMGEPVAVDDLGHPATTPAVRTPARRAREIERANRECVEMNA